MFSSMSDHYADCCVWDGDSLVISPNIIDYSEENYYKFEVPNGTNLKEKEPMEKKKVFQYMVLLHETEEDKTNPKAGPTYKDTKVIIDLKTVMAKSEKELVFKITREIPEQYATEPDNVQIMIRPF